MRVLADPDGPLDRTVPAHRPITIDDLMTHRSGLAYAFSVQGPIGRAYATVSLRQDQDHWLAEVAGLPLVHQPGERLTYSKSTEVLGIAYHAEGVARDAHGLSGRRGVRNGRNGRNGRNVSGR